MLGTKQEILEKLAHDLPDTGTIVIAWWAEEDISVVSISKNIKLTDSEKERVFDCLDEIANVNYGLTLIVEDIFFKREGARR